MKNVVLIGGGTGLSCILKGIKDIKSINFSVIVSVADSGGSTGKIRKECNLPAVGDIRKIISALADDEGLLKELLDYRFANLKKEDILFDHSLGNLIIAALCDMKKDFYQAVETVSRVFKINGEIIPVSDSHNLTLKAIYDDGSCEIHEHNIPNISKKIDFVTYDNNSDIRSNPKAALAIKRADLIIFGPGSLYTSIFPNIIFNDIKQAIINNTTAQLIYLSNIVTQPGETTGMDVVDHLQAIEKHLDNKRSVDLVVVNKKIPENKLIEHYQKTNSELLLINKKLESSKYKYLGANLLNKNNKLLIRHDYNKIRIVFNKIFNKE